MSDLKTTLIEFEEAKDRLDELKDLTSEAQALYDEYRHKKILDAMREAGILDAEGKGSCTTPSGRKVYVTTDTRAYIRKEDEDLAFSKIREMGFEELIRETIHHQTLTAWIKERLANAEELPPGVQLSSYDKAVLRKS